MDIKQCVVCHKDFIPIVGNQIKCPLCRNSKVRKTEAHTELCILCGKPFSTTLYNKKFCGRKCREAYHYTPVIQNKKCNCCGKAFKTTKGNKKYCSDYCALQAKVGKLDYLKVAKDE